MWLWLLQSFFFGLRVGRNFVFLLYGFQELADAFGNIGKFSEPADHERITIRCVVDIL